MQTLHTRRTTQSAHVALHMLTPAPHPPSFLFLFFFFSFLALRHTTTHIALASSPCLPPLPPPCYHNPLVLAHTQPVCFPYMPTPQLSLLSSPSRSIPTSPVRIFSLSLSPSLSHTHTLDRFASFVIRLIQPYNYGLLTPPSTPPSSIPVPVPAQAPAAPAAPAPFPLPNLVAFINNVMARSRGSFATLLVANIYLHRLRSQLPYYRPAGTSTPTLPSSHLPKYSFPSSRSTNNSSSSVLCRLYRRSVHLSIFPSFHLKPPSTLPLTTHHSPQPTSSSTIPPW
jgi:hypothetical protein